MKFQLGDNAEITGTDHFHEGEVGEITGLDEDDVFPYEVTFADGTRDCFAEAELKEIDG